MNLRIAITLIGMCALYSCGTVELISGSVTHVSCANPNSGSIDQTFLLENLGSFVVKHNWNTGATTEDISGLAPIYPQRYIDNISINGLGSTTKYDVFYNVEWDKLQSMSYSASTLTLTDNSPSGVSFAGSRNILSENAIGCIEWKASETRTTGLDYGVLGFNPKTDYYGYSLNNFTGIFFLFYDGLRYFSVLEKGTFKTTAQLFSLNDRFSIKYTDHKVEYYRNGNLVYRDPTPVLITTFYTHPEMYIEARMERGRIQYKDVRSSFGCSIASDYYAELEKELDASVYTMTNSIKFRYKEKYNDDVLNYVIYDWKRTPLFSDLQGQGQTKINVQTTNYNGTNFHKIPISTGLRLDEVYTLEVTNDKGEVYKMKFKYDKQVPVGDIGRIPPPTTAITKYSDKLEFGNDYE